VDVQTLQACEDETSTPRPEEVPSILAESRVGACTPSSFLPSSCHFSRHPWILRMCVCASACVARAALCLLLWGGGARRRIELRWAAAGNQRQKASRPAASRGHTTTETGKTHAQGKKRGSGATQGVCIGAPLPPSPPVAARCLLRQRLDPARSSPRPAHLSAAQQQIYTHWLALLTRCSLLCALVASDLFSRPSPFPSSLRRSCSHPSLT
jgi:hypothetical protein